MIVIVNIDNVMIPDIILNADISITVIFIIIETIIALLLYGKIVVPDGKVILWYHLNEFFSVMFINNVKTTDVTINQIPIIRWDINSCVTPNVRK
jgi:hypothetical protein